jgi:hypothetical protein
MKSPIATMGLACTLAAAAALAQGPPPLPNPSGGPRNAGPGASPATPGAVPATPGAARTAPGAGPAIPGGVPTTPGGAPAYNPGSVDMGLGTPPTTTFEPTPPDRLGAPTIPLPNDPIEPYLLTKENGPFMVTAKSFRGPDAERFALALVLELRRDYGLPAYILRYKDIPQHSLIRDIPPTAPTAQNRPHVGLPEKYRTYDEAIVLIGNEKTVKDRDVLLHKVKKIRPQCLNGLPKLYPWREGLDKATGTTNPFVPAQDLYSAPRRNKLIVQMNEGPRSVMNCPGRYSLQIAEFAGRSTLIDGRGQGGVVMDQQFLGDQNLKKSPLATAAQDAESLAEALAKDPEVRQTGYYPYTYHDLTSSKVLIGSFNAPDDPAAAKLRDQLLRMAVPLANKKVTPTMIVPANALTDLEPIKAP